MRIHSKFSDFYDTALGMGIDESLHFVRESSPIPNSKVLRTDLCEKGGMKKDSWLSSQKVSTGYLVNYWKSSTPEFQSWDAAAVIVVGFCGILYPAIRVIFHNSFFVEEKFFYHATDYAGLDEFLQKQPTFYQNLIRQGSSSSRYVHGTKQSRLDKIHLLCDNLSKVDYSRYFIDNKVPYFVIDLDTYILKLAAIHAENIPRLVDLNFVNVKDPWTAMQELSMYLGGVIPRQVPEMVNITDKDRVVQHGFDELSFRKLPTKRR